MLNVRMIMTRKTRKTRRTSREFKGMHPSPHSSPKWGATHFINLLGRVR